MHSNTRPVSGHAVTLVVLFAFVPGCASTPDSKEAGADIRDGATAVHPVASEPLGVEFLNSGKILPTNLPFSEAVRVGDVLYLSGQIGVLPGTARLAPGGTREEGRQAMENIRTTLPYPARSALGANGLALGARVEVECIAAVRR